MTGKTALYTVTALIVALALIPLVEGVRSENRSDVRTVAPGADGSTNESSDVSSSAHPVQEKKEVASESTSRVISVDLPDGRSHSVSLRPRERPSMDVPLSAAWDDLIARFEQGDGNAAYSLFFGLSKCLYAPRTEESLNKELERLHADGRVRFPVNDSGVETYKYMDVPEGEDLAKVEEVYVREPSRFCSGISDQMLEERESWLMRAAELSSIDALKELARRPPVTSKTIEYLERAWQGGDVMALDQLGVLYRDGWGEVPMEEADPMLAYASLLIFSEFIEAGYLSGARADDLGSDTIASRFFLELSNVVRRLESNLHEHEVERARNMATQLLTENAGCCVDR